MLDEQFVGVFRPSVLKAGVMEKKSDDIALPWAGAASEGFDVPLCQGPKPPPALTQRVAAASNDLIDTRFAGEKAPGEHSYEGYIRHE